MLLDSIQKANDIKKIKEKDLDSLAAEIRQFLIEKISVSGGHLGSNLGAVELTMALHLSLDLPTDKIVWDVGHQSYTHKILTGRREGFETLRKFGGMSGFPKRKESDCDSFDTGHSSTSISAGLGLAQARDLLGERHTVVSVIGHGSLTGGMAYEALNNCSDIHSNFIIILNDNDMSISSSVGGMSKVLNNVRTGQTYNELKYNVKNTLSRIPGYGDELIGKIHKTKSSIKQFFIPGMLFEDMGITYLGPVDGHDINKLVKMIKLAKRVNHAVLVHVHTQKGHGYSYAEKKPCFYHGVDAFDVDSGELLDKTKVRSYSDVFSSAIIKCARNDDKVVAITAAMSDGTGLKRFEKMFPDRFFDVGIAEEHAVTFAAGLAAAGYKPYFAVYSSFLQRGFDQILHDVCIQKLPVRFIVERAGIVGRDGITHQGIFDLSYLGIIPGLTIMAPKNRFEFHDMIQYTLGYDKPVAIRVPRGAASDIFREIRTPIEYGRSEIIRKGERVAIVAAGTGIETAAQTEELLADKGINPTIVNARFVKPFDTVMIEELSRTHDLIVTIEENVMSGGFGMSVLSYVNSNNLKVKVLNIALEDKYIEHGSAQELKEAYGLSPEKICAQIEAEI